MNLWLSYQRYALGLFVLIFVWSAGVAYVGYTFSGWWMILMLPVLWAVGFAVEISRQYPRKLKLTQQAQAAIQAQTFHPDMLRNYCADPCYRVVADHILRQAGYKPEARRAVIQAHREALQAAREKVVVFDLTSAEDRLPPEPLPSKGTVRFLSTQQPQDP